MDKRVTVRTATVNDESFISSFLSNSFDYMLLWFTLLVVYLVYKARHKYLGNRDNILIRFLNLYTFGTKKGDKSLDKLESQNFNSKKQNDDQNSVFTYNCAVKFFICFIGLQCSFLLWGLMQERIIKYDYISRTTNEFSKFKNSQFLVFSNRISGLVLSFTLIFILNSNRLCRRYSIYKIGKISDIAPLFICSYSSLSNVISSWFQYEALKYVSFTTQLLAKSSKSVFVMLVGRVVNKKHYKPIEYGCVCIIAFGLYLFSDVEQTLQQNDTDSIIQTTLPGIVCLLCYLISDSFTSNWQDNLLKSYKMSSLSLMFITNLYSCAFTLISLIKRDQLLESLNFMFEHTDFMYHLYLLSLTSCIGQIFIFITIEQFGALVFTLIMTTRQVLSIILSCLFFNHELTMSNKIGTCFIFFALFFQQFYKIQTNKTKRMPKKSTEITKISKKLIL